MDPRAKREDDTCERRGFSLIELLAVLAVLAAAAALAAPAMARALPGLQLRSDARAVARILEATALRTVDERRALAVTIDPMAARLAPDGAAALTLKHDTQVRVIAAREDASAAGDARIVFYPDGTASGGRIELARGPARIAIETDWLTGNVRTFRVGDGA